MTDAMRLEDLARRLGALVEGDGDVEITGVAAIEEAEPGDLTFLANPRYRSLIATTRASAIVVSKDEECARQDRYCAPAEPYATFAAALALFDRRPTPRPGIHATAGDRSVGAHR
jgi:UDP-3-O-[3-hydroxymyristoyl] glucosamine N-acyltransferase